MEHLARILEMAAQAIDVIGIVIVLIGAIKFLLRIVPLELRKLRGAACAEEMRHLRLELGSYILLSIEFMIVSDIINTVLFRTMEDLYFLLGLVVIRTAISYFLGKELSEVQSGADT